MKLKIALKNILKLTRYVLGTWVIFMNFIVFSAEDGYEILYILFILFGISLIPISYKILKLNNKRLHSMVQICIPLIILILIGKFLPSDYEEHNKTKNITPENQIVNIIKESKSPYHYITNIDSIDDKYSVQIDYKRSGLTPSGCYVENMGFISSLEAFELIDQMLFDCYNDDGFILKVGFKAFDLEYEIEFYDNKNNVINIEVEQLKKDYIQEYKNASKELNYKDVLRNPSDYLGVNAYWFGNIVQVVQKDEKRSIFRVSVNCKKHSLIEGYDCSDTIYVTYFGNESFIEDDMVNMWGVMTGTKSYISVLGAEITIPSFIAEYIELN